MKSFMKLLPSNLYKMFLRISPAKLEKITEIRFRVNSPVYIYCDEREWSVCETGLSAFNGTVFTQKDAEDFWRNICDYSSYTLLESQRQGFVTVQGGHRIGLCGDIAMEQDKIRHIKKITSFCVRIAHQCSGCGLHIYDYLLENNRPLSALIVSPPGCGKTTVLRDLARLFSDNGYSVCIADERNEIAACKDGIPGLNVGKRTDVYAGCPKHIAMNNMLRSLRPSIIMTDELGGGDDVLSAAECAKSGVSVIASVHGSSYGDIIARNLCGSLIKNKTFQRIVILSDRNGPGTLEDILSENGESLLKKSGERKCC